MLLQKAINKVCYWNEKISTHFKRRWIRVKSQKIYIGSDIGMRRNYLTSSYFNAFEAICNQYLMPGDIVLDVGAHVGVTGSLMWQSTNPGGRVFAFEPNPDVYKVLTKNIQVNHMQNFEASNVLCGDAQDSFTFFVNPDHTGLSSINCENLFSPSKYIEIKIPMIRLSKFCEEKDIIPNFVKIDTQGAELEVLKGLRDHLKIRSKSKINEISSRPLTIYIEFWPLGIERISKVHSSELLKFCEDNELKILKSEHFNNFICNNKISEDKRNEFVKSISALPSQYTNLVLQTN